jgi:hypothetical protein
MQVSTIRKQYATALAAWTTAFPHLQHPSASWWQTWLRDNDYTDILEAIKTLQGHSAPVRARYTTDSVSRAITTLLREIALQRAIPVVPAAAPKPEEPK